MSETTVAATQMTCSNNVSENIDRAESLIRDAASKGAQVILIQELFESQYFAWIKRKNFLIYQNHSKTILR